MLRRANPRPVEAAVPAATLGPSQATRLPLQRRLRLNASCGFTLVELLVSLGVLALLVLLATSLVNSAATITTLGHKQMDADSQARQLLDRMAVDFAQMVKRPDVDYYLKSPQTAPPDCTTCEAQTGVNDRIAFFGATSGYYPISSYQSPVSLVGYRINSDSTSSSYTKLERMGKGFVWNGVSSSYKPVLFLDSATAPTTTIASQWPAAVSSSLADPDGNYEIIGPQVFRFEYYYLLANGSFRDTPWDTTAGHTNVTGMRDVQAIVVDIAVIDTKSKVLLSDTTTPPQIAQVASQLIDWGNTACAGCPTQVRWQTTPGLLRTTWQTALNANTLGLPRPAISGIRLYERYFYLSPPTL
jgi:prepilin-type N-terminal cleavage/methylation domain-containing protein